MLLQFGWFALGLFLLALGADSFLKGASGMALRLGISPFVVGLVVVGFGTSSPELAVNLSAAFKGSYELAVGNVVGSNIANIGLILGSCALLAPLAVQMRLLRVEAPLMIGASLLLWGVCWLGRGIGRFEGVLLLVLFVALIVYVLRSGRRESAGVQQELAQAARTQTDMVRNLLRLALGLFLLVYGANLMVDAAVALARMWGWSELVIGLTVVAIGTSMPELASSLLAVVRGQTDLAVGNVIGSNLFNILLILGATSLVHPLPVAQSLLYIEIPAMIAFALTLYPMIRGDLIIARREGAVLLAAYLGFIGWQLYVALS